MSSFVLRARANLKNIIRGLANIKPYLAILGNVLSNTFTISHFTTRQCANKDDLNVHPRSHGVRNDETAPPRRPTACNRETTSRGPRVRDRGTQQAQTDGEEGRGRGSSESEKERNGAESASTSSAERATQCDEAAVVRVRGQSAAVCSSIATTSSSFLPSFRLSSPPNLNF